MWKIRGITTDELGARLYLDTRYDPKFWSLKLDSFQTFRMLVKSFVTSKDFTVIYSQLPETIPDVQAEDDVISVPLLLIRDTTTPPELLRTYALLWIGFVDSENDFGGKSFGSLQLQCTQADGDRTPYNFNQVSRVASSVETALLETLKTLGTRKVLKASRADLVAQLYKPSRVGVDEATFDRYFPESGDEMYGTFKFRGGKRSKRAKRSKRSNRATRSK